MHKTKRYLYYKPIKQEFRSFNTLNHQSDLRTNLSDRDSFESSVKKHLNVNVIAIKSKIFSIKL